MRAPPPGPGLLRTGDDEDPVAEASQRLCAAMQAAQGVLTSWAVYGQRRDADDARHAAVDWGRTREVFEDAAAQRADAERQLRSFLRVSVESADRPADDHDPGGVNPVGLVVVPESGEVRRRAALLARASSGGADPLAEGLVSEPAARGVGAREGAAR